MKILYVVTRSDVMGGASVHLLDLASEVKKRGHDIHILAGGRGMLQSEAKAKNMDVESLHYLVRNISPINDVKAFFELRHQIKLLKPDLVHLHSSKAGLIGRLACASMGVPNVFTAHGWAFTEGVSKSRRAFYRLLERLVASLAGKIIAVSDYDRQLALQYKVVAESHLVTVHNGVSDKAERVKIVQHHDKAEVRFIMVARFEQPKNQHRLLSIFSKLSDLPWHLEFVGDGPEMSEAIEYSQQLGISAKVTFSGARSDVPDRLASADVFILLSRWEGLPLTILEAMSLGLPVVASDVGGVKEAIDQQCGFLVGSKDDEQLLEILRKLISSTTLRFDMGRAARVRYEQHFTLQRMIDDTLTIYNQVIQKQ